MIRCLVLGFALLGSSASAATLGTFDWGHDRNGYGFCYEYDRNGNVLNGGRPVRPILCEEINPSYPDWAPNAYGWGDCFQFTPYGHVMNMGRPQPYGICEEVSPSYYRWARGTNGYTYCFQFAGNGLVLNDGLSVNPRLCRY